MGEAERTAWEARHAAWAARHAAWEAHVARRSAFGARKDIDTMSESGASSSSTAASSSAPGLPLLSVPEEKEARKLERKLREVVQLEERMAKGETLEALQLAKVGRRVELEATLVMQKIRAGYGRRSDISAGC